MAPVLARANACSRSGNDLMKNDGRSMVPGQRRSGLCGTRTKNNVARPQNRSFFPQSFENSSGQALETQNTELQALKRQRVDDAEVDAWVNSASI